MRPSTYYRRRPNRHQRRKQQRLNRPSRSGVPGGRRHHVRRIAALTGAGVLILAVLAARLLA